MIRRGKAAGWLSIPPETLRPWALLNNVAFHEVKPGVIPGRGAALLATKAVQNSAQGAECLLTVPKDLILSLERVQEHAKADRDLREVLESYGDSGRAPRGAILTFLLVQASTACPDLPERIGVHGPFTDYVKSLPLETLPTFWKPEELQLLIGTTLAPATASKLRSLRREYDDLCTSASSTRWFKAVHDQLDFDDWLQVDAMYRSRALDYPNIGHCMVPCIDLANHASDESTIAIYEKDSDGNAILVLRDGKTLSEDDEVTISYGDEKGACEMLFSYGFLDSTMDFAETLFLSLTLPSDDPLAAAKSRIADCAPGFKLIDTKDGTPDWTGDFIWLLCVNGDDRLHFDIARTTDGEEEIQAFFDSTELTGGAAQLHDILAKSEMWDVYRLRAASILQQRVFDQLQVLFGSQEAVESISYGEGTEIRDRPYKLAMEIRRLEFELMEKAYEGFEKQKVELVESEVVKSYLANVNAMEAEQGGEEVDASEQDFS